MRITWRRGPNNSLETFYQGRWQPTTQDWLDARAASGHTLVEDAPALSLSPGQLAQREGPLAPAFGAFAGRAPAAPVAAPTPTPLSGATGGLTAPSGTPYTPEQLQSLYNLSTPPPTTMAPSGRPYAPEELQSLYGPPMALPGQAPVSQANGGSAAPATPNEALRGNNPTAVWNPTTQMWNVDPAAAWNQPGATPTTTAAPTKPARPPEDFSDANINPLDYERYMGVLDRYARGGMVRRYAEGGQVDEPPQNIALPGQEPNAVVGEGLEADNPEFDKPQRLEIVLVPTGKASTFTGYWSEGPVAAKLAPGTLITPVPNHLESVYREQLLPITAMAPPKEPNPEEAMQKMTLPAGAETYAEGGLVPYGSQTNLERNPGLNTLGRGNSLWNDPYRGLENVGFGSVRDYARASQGATERRNQLLILGGRLGGAEDELGFFKRMSPGALSTPIYG